MWFLVQRGLFMLVIVGILSVALFGLLSAMPGNPVDLLITSNPHIKPEDVIRLKKLRGLDQPWYVQYWRWLYGYEEPARPPVVRPIDSATAQATSTGISVSVDLSDRIYDPNFMPQASELLQWLDQLWPKWPSSALAPALKQALLDNDAPSIHKLVGIHDPMLQNAFQRLIEKRSGDNLTLKPLFGAHIKRQHISQTFSEDYGVAALWFVVRNALGQEKVGRVGTAYSTTNAFLKPIPSQVLSDENATFVLDLNQFILDPKHRGQLSFRLMDDSEGTINAAGIYEHRFKHPGQTAVSLMVSVPHHPPQYVAFDIEHGAVGRKDKFNRGVIYIFAGHSMALGYSQTYKRPVFELLFGRQPLCGDGRIEVGETCDKGSLSASNDCTESCFKKSDSIFTKIDHTLSASIAYSGRIGNTLQLMLPALLLSLIVAIPLGIFSAYRQYSLLDYMLNFGAFIGISLPVFWFGIMMIYLFSEAWPLFPAGGIETPGIYEYGSAAVLLDRLNHAILPTMVLSIFYIGRWLRYMRASMLEVLPQDYIRTARAKGLSEKAVVFKHALRNALIPLVTILALSIPTLFGGAVLTETVFSWPGIGRLQYEAVINNDYYVAIIVFLISAILVMLANLVADLLYILVDPRMRKNG